jgi:hypothetical protein
MAGRKDRSVSREGREELERRKAELALSVFLGGADPGLLEGIEGSGEEDSDEGSSDQLTPQEYAKRLDRIGKSQESDPSVKLRALMARAAASGVLKPVDLEGVERMPPSELERAFVLEVLPVLKRYARGEPVHP